MKFLPFDGPDGPTYVHLNSIVTVGSAYIASMWSSQKVRQVTLINGKVIYLYDTPQLMEEMFKS